VERKERKERKSTPQKGTKNPRKERKAKKKKKEEKRKTQIHVPIFSPSTSPLITSRACSLHHSSTSFHPWSAISL
jgi:hypothetical protein